MTASGVAATCMSQSTLQPSIARERGPVPLNNRQLPCIASATIAWASYCLGESLLAVLPAGVRMHPLQFSAGYSAGQK